MIKKDRSKYSPTWKENVKGSLLSGSYRKFRRMFRCQCANCGSTHCCTTTKVIYKENSWKPWKPKKEYLFNKVEFGFMCVKCGSTWMHPYNLEDKMKEHEKYAKDPNSSLNAYF